MNGELMTRMLSSRPYLLRALYEWINDSGTTPHLLVDTQHVGVEVPKDYVQDGRIVLNISPSAVQDLVIDNEWVSCNARFAGIGRTLQVPIAAVMAIYARENGQGMAFGSEPGQAEGTSPSDESQEHAESTTQKKKLRPNLKVVK